MPAGSCRSICGQSHGRCQPLHHTCKKGNNYAQGCSVSLLHLGRASKVLKAPPKRKSVDCRLCRVFVSFSSGTGEGNLNGKMPLPENLGFVLFKTNV